MLQHLRRALEPVEESVFDEFNKHPTSFLVLNAFATVLVVYLAAFTSLNRWRALSKYDEVVTSPDSPLAFTLKSAPKSTHRAIKLAKFVTYATFFTYLGWCTYASFSSDYQHGFDNFMILWLFLFGTAGLSTITRIRSVEGVFRVQSKPGWMPCFMDIPINKTEAKLYVFTFVSLGMYTAIYPNPWLLTVAVLGVVFRLTASPFIPNKFISVRGVVLVILGYIFATSALVGVLIALPSSSTKTHESKSKEDEFMGIHTIAWYSGALQYTSYFSGVLAALVLRAEWAAAQAAAETQVQADFDFHPAEKESFLEKLVDDTVPEYTELPTSAPTVEPAATPAEASDAEVPVVKPRAIRVPPVDPFHLKKDAKVAGRLEPFASPVFNIMLLATFACSIPSIVLSTPAYKSLITANSDLELFYILPGQFWSIVVNPLVLVIVLLFRWNKGGKEIWYYGEKWSKDLPKKETETPATPAPVEAVDVESQTQPLI